MIHKLRRKIFTGFLTANKQSNPYLCYCSSVAQSCLTLCDTVDCGSGHRVDGDRASGNGVATVIIEREGEGIGSRSIGHESEGDVAGLARH